MPGRDKGRPLAATLYAVVVHGVAFCIVLYPLVFLVPRYEQTFQRLRVTVPALTELVMELSRAARSYAVALLLPFLVGDGLLFYFLRSRCRSRAPATLWSALIMLLVLAAAVAIVVGLHLPLQTVNLQLRQ